MPRERMFLRGRVVRSIASVSVGLRSGRWYFWRGSLMNPGFMCSWQFNYLAGEVSAGRVSKALPNPAYIPKPKPTEEDL